MSANISYPYRCYALMKPDGGWRSWSFAPDSPTVHQRFHKRAGQEVLFSSVQVFPQPLNMAGMLRWKEASGQYRGEEALPHIAPLYFDIDCEDGLDDALLLTHALYEFFTGELEVSPDHVGVWFSGSKGAHLLVHYDALGIRPSVSLTADMKPIAMSLCDQLARKYGVPDLSADGNVYSMPRMLRAENGLNPKSGLYKVRITAQELATCDSMYIKKIASTPRQSFNESNDEIPVAPKAVSWWEQELKKVDEPREFRKQSAQAAGVRIRPDGFTEDDLSTSDMPACVSMLIKSSPPEGKRNRSEMQIACWARSAGKSLGEAVQLLGQWIQCNRPELQASQCQRRAQGIAGSAYSGKYGFSCMAMQSALRDSGRSADCSACDAVTRKHPRMLSSVYVGRVDCHVRETISLEEARERTGKLAAIACAC